MPTPEMDEFARLLVQQVRDRAIRNCDRALQPDCQSQLAKRWRRVLADCKPEVADGLITDFVDQAVSEILRAIDHNILRLVFTTSDGKTIDLSEESFGELCGWYNGSSNGWRGMYAKERFVDYFADLRYAAVPDGSPTDKGAK